jgi:putative MATE family efflux protein
VFELSTEDITEGSLLRALLLLAAPLLVQQLALVANQVADLVFLGRFSGAAVAGVSLAFPAVVLLFAVVAIGPFVGTQVLVSQRVGADDRAGARRALGTGLATAVGLGLAVGAVAYLVAPALVDLLTAVRPAGTDPAVEQAAVDYLRVVGLGLVAIGLGDTLEAGFVGWGDSRASLYVNLATVGTNVVLDPLLIFGFAPLGIPSLGVTGAGLALVCGSLAAFLLGAAMLAAGRAEGLVGSETFAPDTEEVRELLDIGGPSAAQQVARQSVRLVVVVIVFAAAGGAGLAAYFVGARVAAVAFVPAVGLQQAAQSVVGQNLGAERPDRAGRTTWLGVAIAAGGLAVVGAAQWFVPGDLAVLLVPELSGEALALAEQYLRILAYGYPAIGAAYLLEGGFNAARRTRTSFVATLCQFWAVRLPIAAAGVFLLGYGVQSVFWAVTISNVVVAVGLAVYYHREVDRGMLGRAAETASG